MVYSTILTQVFVKLRRLGPPATKGRALKGKNTKSERLTVAAVIFVRSRVRLQQAAHIRHTLSRGADRLPHCYAGARAVPVPAVLEHRGGLHCGVSRQTPPMRFSPPPRGLGPPQKRPSFGIRECRLDLCLTVFRRDGAMGLFLVLFWCANMTRRVLRFNSWFGTFIPLFGVFIPRLSPNKFPFLSLRGIGY
jgi:hypothetical protein